MSPKIRNQSRVELIARINELEAERDDLRGRLERVLAKLPAGAGK